jgi:hypothetical protein
MLLFLFFCLFVLYSLSPIKRWLLDLLRILSFEYCFDVESRSVVTNTISERTPERMTIPENHWKIVRFRILLVCNRAVLGMLPSVQAPCHYNSEPSSALKLQCFSPSGKTFVVWLQYYRPAICYTVTGSPIRYPAIAPKSAFRRECWMAGSLQLRASVCAKLQCQPSKDITNNYNPLISPSHIPSNKAGGI